jgi:threonyl-tRNA synthetase
MKLTESRIKEIIKEEMSRVNEQDQNIEQLEKNYNDAMEKFNDQDIKAHIIAYISALKGNQ